MMKILGLATALLACAPAASHAAMLSAQDLVTDCSGDATAMATCNGYLMAVTDIALRRESRASGEGKVCVPETVTVAQVREAVLSVAHGPGGQAAVHAPTGLRLVARALRATWPCDPASKPR